MREYRFRYTFKRKEDGYIWQQITSIECLEGKGDRDLIGRDLWTGLKDKNNVDIYEGDILLGGQSKNGIVVFENGTFTVWGQPLGWDVETYSEQPEPSSTETWALVIGNIYENPELLNTKQ